MRPSATASPTIVPTPGEVHVSSAAGLSARDVAAEWDALADRLQASPFLRPGWFAAYHEAFRPGPSILLLARRDGRLAGVLPLVHKHGSIVSPTNWHTPEFGPLTTDDAVRQALTKAALSRVRRRLDLGFLGEGEAVLDLLSSHASAAGWRVLTRTIEHSPYVMLDGSWEKFEAAMPGKRHRDLRRRWRRLEATGSVEVECATGGQRLAELLREGWSVEAAGWKGAAGTAVAAQPATARFYERIAKWAAAEGWLRLFFLRVDGDAIAFAYCLVDSRSHYVLKIGFDPAKARFAPGILLTRSMLSQAFAAGLDTYEFLGQADPYKLVWTDRLRPRRRIQVFPESPLGAAEYLAWRRGRPLVKRLLRR